MMTLFVKYTCKPGCREPFLREIATRGIDTAIRAENGCICYDYYLSVQDPNVILLVEKWTEPEAQKVHMTQPHMKDLSALKTNYVLDTVLGDGAL